MKKTLLLLLPMAMMPWRNAVLAQCDVSNLIVSNVRPTPATVGSETGVNYTIDLQFQVQENNGNKYTWIHLWLEKDYMYDSWHTVADAPYPCPLTSNAAVRPPVKDGSSEQAILGSAILNFGFDIQLVGLTPSTNGIMNTYPYDPAVIMNNNGATIKKNPLPDGKTYDVYVYNVTFFKANASYTDYLAVRAFDWATNSMASTGKAQCYSCANRPFVIGDPTISGNVNCVYPRTFNLFIDSRFDLSSTPGMDPLTGNYTMYCDVNRNATYEPATDFMVKAATSFITTNVAVPDGFNSRFMQLNGLFDYNFTMGDTNSTKNIIVIVSIDNPEYMGADVSGILTNNCSVLPVTLKDFDAQKNQNSVRLTWETVMEYSFSGFDIQRRLGNSGSFESIGFVAARAEEQAGAVYSFLDPVLPSGTMGFYRLRMVDADGKASFSQIKAVRNDARRMYVSVTPNPSNGIMNVTLPADAGIYDLLLLDFSGKVLRNMQGQRNQLLRLSGLMPGMYVLKIQFRETGEQIAERIIVQ